MNWGKGIIIAMALFMGFILTLVITLMRQDVDLEIDDYYNKELAFNEQYNAQQNYMDAAEKITFNVTTDSLFVIFPKDLQTGKATIQLQRPNNKQQDAKFEVKAAALVYIPTKSLPKGVFNCTIIGKRNGKSYEYNHSLKLK
jgi:nitrogen fixation protein FixH